MRDVIMLIACCDARSRRAERVAIVMRTLSARDATG